MFLKLIRVLLTTRKLKIQARHMRAGDLLFRPGKPPTRISEAVYAGYGQMSLHGNEGFFELPGLLEVRVLRVGP